MKLSFFSLLSENDAWIHTVGAAIVILHEAMLPFHLLNSVTIRAITACLQSVLDRITHLPASQFES